MLSLLLTCALVAAPPAPAPSPALVAVQDDIKAEYAKRREAAKGDAAKLWKLVNWCEANSLNKEKRSCLRELIKLDPDDVKARELLGHVEHDGKWFPSKKKRDAYIKKQERERAKQLEKEAKEKGWVKWKDGWADPADIPYLEKGWERDETGQWYDPIEVKRLEEGWVQQDRTWVSPEEIPNIDKGLWKCGDEWLTLEQANEYHSEVGKWWEIPGAHFVLLTTLPREHATEAIIQIDGAYRELVRIFGTGPAVQPDVVVLNSPDQYGAFAAGDQNNRGVEVEGLSSVHGAFFADAWFDIEGKRFFGTGVSYWDTSNEAGNRFGKLFARHAAGLAFIEGIDPSPKTIKALFASSAPRYDIDKFYGEKLLPRWFREGAASYAERYYADPSVGPNGDTARLRKWSVSNILNRGGLDPLADIFKMNLTADGSTDSAKLMNEAGLLVAFMLDGDCKPLKLKHSEIKAHFKKRDAKALEKAFKELEALLKQNEGELRMWGNV
jgi:hypothetical protein